MPRQATKALCIPIWFHPKRGHEPTNRGRSFLKPLDFYIARVHTGATRARIARTDGTAMVHRCVSVYDLACQLAANLPLEARGWLCDRFGLHLEATGLAHEFALEVDDITPVIATCCSHDWLRWANPASPPKFCNWRTWCALHPPPKRTRSDENGAGARSKEHEARSMKGQGESAAVAALRRAGVSNPEFAAARNPNLDAIEVAALYQIAKAKRKKPDQIPGYILSSHVQGWDTEAVAAERKRLGAQQRRKDSLTEFERLGLEFDQLNDAEVARRWGLLDMAVKRVPPRANIRAARDTLPKLMRLAKPRREVTP